MDRGLKERLVGAAVLVALGVWLIPWILDGSNEPAEVASDSLTLPVPGSDETVRSQTVTLENDREQPTPVRETTRTTIDEPATEVPVDEVAVVAAEIEPGWYVQAGSFEDVDNARRQAERVSGFGYEAEVSTTTSGGRTLQRVRIGPQNSHERAEAIASALSAHGFVVQVVGPE